MFQQRFAHNGSLLEAWVLFFMTKVFLRMWIVPDICDNFCVKAACALIFIFSFNGDFIAAAYFITAKKSAHFQTILFGVKVGVNFEYIWFRIMWNTVV